jgi:hypothetical protein
MKDNQFMKIVLYVLIIVFIFLLLRNTKSLEGYDLTSLNVGNWKLTADSSKLDVLTTDSGKSVNFNAPVNVQGLKIMTATENKGVMKSGDTALIIPGNGLFIGTQDGTGMRIDKEGNFTLTNNIFTSGDAIRLADGNMAFFYNGNSNIWTAGGWMNFFTNSKYAAKFSPQQQFYVKNTDFGGGYKGCCKQDESQS